MEQYIPKSALVAEIEKLENVLSDPLMKINGEDYINGGKKIIKEMKSFLNTLEVKEVDLDKETTHYLLYEHRSPLNEIMHKADLKSEIQYHKDIENAFKAGFELGLKAQKGE